MRNRKQLIAMLLAAVLLAAIPVQASADTHTHQWSIDHYDYGYVPNGLSGHYVSKFPVFYCKVPGCNQSYIGDAPMILQSHTWSSYKLTGSNYHSGSLHYVRYEKHCIQCGYTDGYWSSYSCPGNGSCILPYAFSPVPAVR